jgi:hypothetical protein
MPNISNHPHLSMANLQEITKNLNEIKQNELGNLQGRKITIGKQIINIINRIITYIKTGSWTIESGAMKQLSKEISSLKTFIEQNPLNKKDKRPVNDEEKLAIVDADRTMRVAIHGRLKEIEKVIQLVSQKLENKQSAEEQTALENLLDEFKELEETNNAILNADNSFISAKNPTKEKKTPSKTSKGVRFADQDAFKEIKQKAESQPEDLKKALDAGLKKQRPKATGTTYVTPEQEAKEKADIQSTLKEAMVKQRGKATGRTPEEIQEKTQKQEQENLQGYLKAQMTKQRARATGKPVEDVERSQEKSEIQEAKDQKFAQTAHKKSSEGIKKDLESLKSAGHVSKAVKEKEFKIKEDIGLSLKNLIFRSYLNEDFKKSLGYWKGENSKENLALHELLDKDYDYNKVSKEDLIKDASTVIELIEKGFTQNTGYIMGGPIGIPKDVERELARLKNLIR